VLCVAIHALKSRARDVLPPHLTGLLLLLLQGTAVLKGNFDIKSLELVLSTLQVGCHVMCLPVPSNTHVVRPPTTDLALHSCV
jgi:hypothetical protein